MLVPNASLSYYARLGCKPITAAAEHNPPLPPPPREQQALEKQAAAAGAASTKSASPAQPEPRDVRYFVEVRRTRISTLLELSSAAGSTHTRCEERLVLEYESKSAPGLIAHRQLRKERSTGVSEASSMMRSLGDHARARRMAPSLEAPLEYSPYEERVQVEAGDMV